MSEIKLARKTQLLGRMGFVILSVIVAVWFIGMGTLKAENMVVYKSASCGCCGAWVKHLEDNGFSVQVENVDDLNLMKQRLSVPKNLASCHTGVVAGYLVEGHVPASDILRLLKEKPAVKGIAVPGMPMGSPGMEIPGEKADSYDVITFSEKGDIQLFSRY